MKKNVEFIIVPALILWLIFSVLSFIGQKSLICDEVSHHIASGYSYVKTADYRMNPATPSLIRTLIALPLLPLDLRLPLDHVSWQTNDSPEFGRLFLYVYNEYSDKIAFLARTPILVLSVLLALLVYAWARELFGPRAAVLALCLYCFSPDILGNSGLAMADLGGTFFMTLAVYTFWRLMKDRTPARAVLAGVTFGLAQASKHTAVFLVPFYILVILSLLPGSGKPGKTLMKGLSDLAVIFITGMVTIWATYSFEFKPLLATAPDIAEKIGHIRALSHKVPFVGSDALADRMVFAAGNVPIPFPSFLISLLGVTNQVLVTGQPLFFLGQRHLTGMKFYYCFLFLMKMPLPVIYLMILSAAGGLLRKRTSLRPPDNICLILPIALISLFVSVSKVQGGMRYLIPIYPFLFIWISDSINIKLPTKSLRIAGTIFFSVMVAWYIWGTARVFPDFLGFYNELAGGPGGDAYRITHDMDWGQDLKKLKKYMDGNDLGEVSLLYFGSALPESYGIRWTELSEDEKNTPYRKVYALSVRYLGAVRWASDVKPSARAGSSIFIYDFRENLGQVKKQETKK